MLNIYDKTNCHTNKMSLPNFYSLYSLLCEQKNSNLMLRIHLI